MEREMEPASPVEGGFALEMAISMVAKFLSFSSNF